MNLDEKILTRMFELFCLRPFVIFKKYFVAFQTVKRSIRQRCKETRLNSNQNKSTVDCSFFKKSCRKNLFYQIRKKKKSGTCTGTKFENCFHQCLLFSYCCSPDVETRLFSYSCHLSHRFFLTTIPGFLLPTKNLLSL